MKNKKGFTLIELLAVLVLLLTILLIAIPSITSSVERNKNNMLKKKYDLIEAQAESYVSMYKNSINYQKFISATDFCGINITKIKATGLLTTDDLKDADNKTITGYIIYNNGDYKYSKSIPSGGEC